MQNLSSYFDENYFENGIKTGKSYYTNYHWMPERSFTEAKAIIAALNLSINDSILDYGCAKGFLVKALRELGYYADGCDISEYALSFAPVGCWNCSDLIKFSDYSYTHVVSKDVFEHLSKDLLSATLAAISKLSNKLTCIVPIGDSGIYRIPEYHLDPSHLIAENEDWWRNKFLDSGWGIQDELDHIVGVKDSWYSVNPCGNRVFKLVWQ